MAFVVLLPGPGWWGSERVEREALLFALLPVVAGVTAIIINRIFDRANQRLAQQNREEDKADLAQQKLVDFQREVIEMKDRLLKECDKRVNDLSKMNSDLETKVSLYENRPNRGVNSEES